MYDKATKVYVIDEIMGRGKTTAMIRRINEEMRDDRILFITPLLTETKRIADACPGMMFYEPEADGGKLNHIKEAISQGRNISSTHALFGMLDSEAIALLSGAGYKLIIDEAPCAISLVDITPYDAVTISTSYSTVEDKGRIVWTVEDYTGKYNVYKDAIERGVVFRYNQTVWVSLIDIDLFCSFKEVYIMTYMFYHQVQRAYFDLYGIEYNRLYVDGDSPETYRIVDYPTATPPMPYKDLIHICQNRKMNAIGEDAGSDRVNQLSKSWYSRHIKLISGKPTDEAKTMRKNCQNFTRNICKVPSRDVLWTTFKEDERYGIDWKKILSGKGYATRFLSCTARGTNDYRNCTALMYLVNRYMNTSIYNFLKANEIEIDQNMFALSEMLQWIWRSAIRDGKEIWIYIPSKRMRTLLENWIEEVSHGSEACDAAV